MINYVFALLITFAIMPVSGSFQAAPPTGFIALTFDDGPNTNFTVQVLDELERFGARASFYVNGSNINDRTRPVLQRMINQGHDVENHTWGHARFDANKTQDEAREDLQRTSQAIFDATGYWPFSFRAPFFEWGGTNNILYGLDRELNMAFIDSGIDTFDWMHDKTAQDIADSILNVTNPHGGIILLHDGGGNRQATVDSLALFIPQMQRKGYAFVTVRELYIITGETPELFRGNTMWPRVNQWVPARSNSPLPLWDASDWHNADWRTGDISPWERN
jgi:peptidoglycan/xylan/chitin deacetylase (PgdA/CDA1 family)